MTMNEVEYLGVKYPVATVTVPGWGTRNISVESLEDAVIVDGSDFRDDLAEVIDSGIFFYVPDETIRDREDCIVDYILENI